MPKEVGQVATFAGGAVVGGIGGLATGIKYGQGTKGGRLGGALTGLARGVADGHAGNIRAVKEDPAAGGLVDAHNDLGEGGFAAAVGPGDCNKAILQSQTDVPENLLALCLETDVL